MNKNNLISYALSFTSFRIDRIEVDNIILFGSVANNTFDKESDIDLFVDTDEKNEKKVRSILELYKKTKEHEKFKISGIKNELSLKIGSLNKWKDLESSIISEGITLYGHFQSQPNQLKHMRLFILNMERTDRKIKVKMWRKLYGYNQKVGEKIYISQGLVDKNIGRGAFLVKIINSQKVVKFLRKNKIKYSFLDIWTE